MAVKCKTFDAYIRELILHPERSKKWMNDKRLTMAEKKILQGHLLVRDNKHKEVIEEISSISDSEMEFVNDHKHLLLGICYNNTGRCTEALKYLRLAAIAFEKAGQNYHLFTTLFNMINNLGNLGKIEEMTPVLQRMVDLRVSGRLPETRLLRSQFIHAVDSNNNQLAHELLPRIQKLKIDMPESELGPQLVCEFMFHIKEENFDKAEAVLGEMKKHRKFMIGENFPFMKKLLSHLVENTTIYVYERDFPSQESALYRQIKVIEALQAQNIEEAQTHWGYLQSRYGKQLYQDDFRWNGEKCLFSLCLDKHVAKRKDAPLKLQLVTGDESKYKLAYKILKNAQAPMRSGELYELLYGEIINDKEDLKKLVSLIMHIRKHYGVEIISRKGTYELVSQPSKRKAITT